MKFNKSYIWAKLTHCKYPRGPLIPPKPTDSTIWKRICSVNHQGFSLTSTNSSGGIIWQPTKDGKFSFSSAYDEVRQCQPSTFSVIHTWNKQQHMKVKLFQWKQLNNLLPLPKNLIKLQISTLPSLCRFCRKDSALSSHIFYHCPIISPIWHYFMGLFHINRPNFLCSPRQIYFSWWLEVRGTTLMDTFKINLPGIISWHIWKHYAEYNWDSSWHTFKPDRVIQQIKHFTQDWSWNLRIRNINNQCDMLKEENFIHPNFSFFAGKVKLIKWLKPKILSNLTLMQLTNPADQEHELSFETTWDISS
ncbi:unnamed protein product [Cuscuta epithymum]|uniref:Reverse transcriptase zinc-binding domain-containing protein n=1 Tax=Cuscuta epithymum TaxID=186058 RepID=A0AAV0F0D5_9ASTE|nr:unnamed protein product [Cuscuta epithymum]